MKARSRTLRETSLPRMAAFAAACLFVSAGSAAELQIDVDVRDVATGYSWGFETGLKQHLGSFMAGRSVHAVSRYVKPNPSSGLPPLGSPDYLVWVDETSGGAAAIEHPAGVTGLGVNPGGNATFGSEPSAGEAGRMWWVLGGRANELPFDLARSSSTFDPFHFDIVADNFYTISRSTSPTLSVVGARGLLAFRYLHSTDPADAVLFHRYDLASSIPSLEFARTLGRASVVSGLGDVTIEQVWSRWDPRRRALAVTWEWYARQGSAGDPVQYFGSNPFIYTDDLGESWKLADGSPAPLPLTYASTLDPRTAPFDHLSLWQSTKWYPRDNGFAPDGTPWLMLPVGSGARQVKFFFWGPSGWESRTLSSDVDEGDPVACGTTRDYVVCAYSEAQGAGKLLLRYSGDNGNTWSGAREIDNVGKTANGTLQRIDWVSFVQPAEGYPDNAARFFVGYYRTSDGSFGRRFKNNIRWVRLEIDGSNSDPIVNIESPVDGSSYEVGTVVDLSASAEDPDGDEVTLQWSADGAPIASPWSPDLGSHVVTVTATDGKGGIATARAAIVVDDMDSPGAPPAPVLQPAIVKKTTATLIWNDVANESGYEIGRWKFNTSKQTCRSLVIFKTVGANVTTTKNTIKQGGSYCYAVRAFNAGGTSDWSNTVRATLIP